MKTYNFLAEMKEKKNKIDIGLLAELCDKFGIENSSDIITTTNTLISDEKSNLLKLARIIENKEENQNKNKSNYIMKKEFIVMINISSKE
jgi:hypothetical protein